MRRQSDCVVDSATYDHERVHYRAEGPRRRPVSRNLLTAAELSGRWMHRGIVALAFGREWWAGELLIALCMG